SACVVPLPLQVVANVVLPQVVARATAPSNPAAHAGNEASGTGGVIIYIAVVAPVSLFICAAALCVPSHGPVVVCANAEGSQSSAKRAAKLSIRFKCAPSVKVSPRKWTIRLTYQDRRSLMR